MGEQSGTAPWQRMMARSVTTASGLARELGLSDPEKIRAVTNRYPMRINPYALARITGGSLAVRRQLVPDPAELEEAGLSDDDPLCETDQSPVPGLVHRYPGRVLFLVSGRCAVYCRHCMRKRVVGGRNAPGPETIDDGLAYIAASPAVREVILSGGDPLVLDDSRLLSILDRLRSMAHVELIRIHTRIPGMLPCRITRELAGQLKSRHPLYINIQFNHPDELTAEAVQACARLADAGIPLGAQTVLLAGVNDDGEVMAELMYKLLAARVKPYYLHHPDPVRGTAHFRVSLEKGMAILESLRGRVPGIGVPHYVIDLPGGGGKVSLLPDSVAGRENGRLVVYNFEKKRYVYPL